MTLLRLSLGFEIIDVDRFDPDAHFTSDALVRVEELLPRLKATVHDPAIKAVAFRTNEFDATFFVDFDIDYDEFFLWSQKQAALSAELTPVEHARVSCKDDGWGIGFQLAVEGVCPNSWDLEFQGAEVSEVAA